jgi:hypothetical protein
LGGRKKLQAQDCAGRVCAAREILYGLAGSLQASSTRKNLWVHRNKEVRCSEKRLFWHEQTNERIVVHPENRKEKTMRYIIALFSIVVLAGCALRPFGQLKSIETKPDEVIVIGHLKVQDKGKDITTETNLFFNEAAWGTYVYRADTSGYIYTKLKVGENHLARIGHKNRLANIPDDYATVTLADAAKVYYIGDISIDVTGMLRTSSGLFGLVGAVAAAGAGGKHVPIRVTNNPQLAIEYFRTKFPNNKEVVISTLVIKGDTLESVR